ITVAAHDWRIAPGCPVPAGPIDRRDLPRCAVRGRRSPAGLLPHFAARGRPTHMLDMDRRGEAMPRAMSGLIALRRALIVCWGGWLCLSLTSVVHAQGAVGSSSREAREDAIRTIPYRQLDPDA